MTLYVLNGLYSPESLEGDDDHQKTLIGSTSTSIHWNSKLIELMSFDVDHIRGGLCLCQYLQRKIFLF